MLSNEVKEKLIAIVTKNNFDDSKIERLVYSYDATPNYQSMPDAIVSPRNAEEVSQILKICNQYKSSNCTARFWYQPLCRNMPNRGRSCPSF